MFAHFSLQSRPLKLSVLFVCWLFLQGLGFLTFTALCLARHYYTSYPNVAARKAALWANLYSQPNSPAAGDNSSHSDALLPLGAVDDQKEGGGSASIAVTPSHVTPTATSVDTPTGGDETKSDPLQHADWSFTLLAAFFCSILTLIGYVVEQVGAELRGFLLTFPLLTLLLFGSQYATYA